MRASPKAKSMNATPETGDGRCTSERSRPSTPKFASKRCSTTIAAPIAPMTSAANRLARRRRAAARGSATRNRAAPLTARPAAVIGFMETAPGRKVRGNSRSSAQPPMSTTSPSAHTAAAANATAGAKGASVRLAERNLRADSAAARGPLGEEPALFPASCGLFAAQRHRVGAMSLSPDTRMGAVTLTVASLARSIDYYEQVVGLRVRASENGVARLGAGGEDLL